MNITNIFNQSFFNQNPKFKDYDENSYLIALVDENDDLVDFITSKKEDFFKDCEPLHYEDNVPYTELTDLISSLEYGVDILKPIDDGEDFYIISPTLISLNLFSKIGFSDLNFALYKPFGKIFPKLTELGVTELFRRGYQNHEKLSLKLMLFSYKTFIYSINYSLRRFRDLLLLITYETTDYDQTRKRESNLFNESIIPLMIYQDNKIVRVNKAYLELSEQKEDNLLDKPLAFNLQKSLNLNHKEQKEIINKVMSHELLYHEDVIFSTNNKGEKVYIKSVIFPVVYHNRNAVQFSFMDITDSIIYEENLKEVNAQLNDLVDQKNVLLKEVHHRVKNNLQIISSLLRLDKRFKVDNPESVFESTENRINSMALIHEKIYQSSDLAHVNIKDYIESEVNHLFNLYHVNNIKLDFNLEEVELDMNQSIPLALIINELITNIIKYAYPNNEEGNVKISLKLVDDLIVFQLEDDGVGLPEDIDIYNNDSLGFTVINGLVHQLEGELEIFDSKGAGYLIKFKKY